MQTLCVVAHIPAKEVKQDELRSVLSRLVEPTRKESGCIRYQLYRNINDPLDFTFVEEWADEAALEKHLQSAHFQAAAAAFPGLVDGAPSVNRYSLIA